jgi:hypothetical protein
VSGTKHCGSKKEVEARDHDLAFYPMATSSPEVQSSQARPATTI